MGVAKNSNFNLEVAITQEKDLGVVIDTWGKQRTQCSAALGKANGVLGCINEG